MAGLQVACKEGRYAYGATHVGPTIDPAVEHVGACRDAEVAMLHDRVVATHGSAWEGDSIALRVAHSYAAFKWYALQLDIEQPDVERLRLNRVL